MILEGRRIRMFVSFLYNLQKSGNPQLLTTDTAIDNVRRNLTRNMKTLYTVNNFESISKVSSIMTIESRTGFSINARRKMTREH
ncbi:hypothetical protein WN51_10897 [Melipona quadrifasciata]|uniref:Uncharacterized protein n=1 Tax=Melipona quadrifasciata TaxID=166423 RepID=A0A0N0BID6_9HYME|nr:hypothetical protein WN51_10897 [Melipona quadrifasciata]